MKTKEITGDCPLYKQTGQMPSSCIDKLGPDDKGIRCSGQIIFCSDPSEYYKRLEAHEQKVRQLIPVPALK